MLTDAWHMTSGLSLAHDIGTIPGTCPLSLDEMLRDRWPGHVLPAALDFDLTNSNHQHSACVCRHALLCVLVLASGYLGHNDI